jgi:serine protease AprX
MTASRPAPSAGPRAVAVRRPRGTAVVTLALAAATVAAGVGATSPTSSAAVQTPTSRVVVTAFSEGADGVRAAAAAVAAAGGQVLDRLPLVGGVSAELPMDAVLPAGLSVAPDRPVEVASGNGAYADGPASPVRETLGLGAPAGEGAGVTVAVVDTGVAPHPDLAGRVTSIDVAGAGAGDGYGHGTFVAGLVAGDGASSGGRYAGVAPGAHVLDVRVADDEGRTDLVTVLRGLQAAAMHDADVVNLSLSSYSPLPYQLDPLTVALGELWERGTVVVVPAGNDGPDAGTITSPGVHPVLLTVGALDEHATGARGDDTVADFSARGPAPQDVPKPELVAPGRSVVSLRPAGSAVDVEHGAVAAVGEHYFKGSGTSFSTAVVSGAAAVLLAERDLTPDQVKLLATGTAYAAEGLDDATAAGAGGLDLAAARVAPAPDVETDGQRGRQVGHVRKDVGVPGTAGEWQPLLRALLRDDAKAAASSWSRLSPEAKAWVASSWSSLPPEMRADLTVPWQHRNWAGASPEEWAARDWAARTWSASSWSASSWSHRNWAASSWSGDDSWLLGWDGRNWAGRNWAASSWSGRNWAGRNWAASSWSGRNWAASSWSGRNWAASSWGG